MSQEKGKHKIGEGRTEKQKVRADLLLVEKGICESREKAKELIISRRVRARGSVVLKPSQKFPEDTEFDVDGEISYVSRGYLKIKGAFEIFGLCVEDKVCADIGCSTGGFTQFLLDMGAKKVYAVDVGKGVLHPKLRENPRVVVMEGVDAKKLRPSCFAELPEFASVDVSFTSSVPVLRNIKFIDEILLLCKPNFEVPRKYLKKGVLKNPEVIKLALKKVIHQTSDIYDVFGVAPSPIRGTSGNFEFFLLLGVKEKKEVSRDRRPVDEIDKIIDEVVEEAICRLG